ncbi:hypothetical protein [Streptomyces sp. 8L]|uniref:hypothetical protein n=1 Tax=Streptomyces sp. 8L TaxID=2877242 RepID=UPI001CD325F0|nr:hypothetical protein [Streptomyces sp. 8L]MCA1221393.1 hypothetical protein [Streptomyces sp. 8L]
MNPTPSTTTTGPDAATGNDTEEKEPTAGAQTADGLADGKPGETGAPEDTDTSGATDSPEDDSADDDALDDGAAPPRTSSGVGVAAAAVVAAALGLTSLTGTWTGRVGAERETLVGQLHTSQTSSTSQQIAELYGDGWHTTAAINGAVALVAAIIAVIVLFALRRATTAGTAWAKPVAVAALVLGAIGVVVSLGMYFDLFASLPSAPATTAPTTTPPAS